MAKIRKPSPTAPRTGPFVVATTAGSAGVAGVAGPHPLTVSASSSDTATQRITGETSCGHTQASLRAGARRGR